MVMISESGQGSRLRAAVDRLHVAQLAALATPEACHAAGADAYGAERRLLEHAAEMGCVLARLGRVEAAVAVKLRQRLVSLAVAASNALAELVELAFEPERVEDEAGEMGAMPAVEAPPPKRRGGGQRSAGGAPGRNGVPSPSADTTSMRAVTDAHRLLIDQLKRLMQHAGRQETWRSARPGELWRGLLLQVAELYPLVAAQEVCALSGDEAKELRRLTADAANYIAFLRTFPRAPTV